LSKKKGIDVIMNFSFGYGKSSLDFNVNDKNISKVLEANEVKIDFTGVAEVKRAMENPIASKRLKEIVKKGEKVAIITSDITRPMPSKLVLPVVVDELRSAGIQDKDITIVFAVGIHRSHTEEERKLLAGKDIYDKIKCIDSNSVGYTHLGETKNGTPLDICNVVVEADRVVCMGNIEFHYFAGYSGGAKAIMPGVSTRDAISANHRNMVYEEAKAGNLDTNPVRIDMEEAGKCVKIDFIINVVLDVNKQIIKAVTGDSVKAHREGCKFLDSLYKIKIPEKADIVITTPGGFPKDLNLYQAQKSLDNAKHAVKDGGIIILIASCNEGLGEKTFKNWMLGFEKPEDMITELKKNFVLGGHKATAIAKVLKKCSVYLISDIEPDLVRKMFMNPYKNVQDAITHAFEVKGEDAKIIVMPHAGSTLPCLLS